MRTAKKYLVSLLATAMVLATVGVASAATTVASAPFTDVTSSTSYATAINFMAAQGVINGVGNGLYQPNTPVTRAEMAKIIVNEAGKGSVATALSSMTPQFTDASSIPTWAWGYVNAAVAMGILKGYPDGTFRANNNVTDAEAAAMFARLLGDDWSVTGTWPNNYILAGYSLDIFKGLSSESANVPALRGEIAQMAYNTALNAQYSTVTSNGQNVLSGNLSSGAEYGLYYKDGTLVTGTASNVGLTSITIGSTTYAYASNVTLVGASALTDLSGSVTATLNGDGMIDWIEENAATTTTAETVNDGTVTTAPSGFNLGTADASGNYTYVTDANGNPYLLFKDGSTLEYTTETSSGSPVVYSGTPITVNGEPMGNVQSGTQNYYVDPTASAATNNVFEGASISATTSNGVIQSVSEKVATLSHARVTAVDTTDDTITVTYANGTGYDNYTTTFNLSSSTPITLNGQASSLSALQFNDIAAIYVEGEGPGATLSANATTSGFTVQSIAATRNTVSGTVTAISNGSSSTFTLQPSSGNAVTLTEDGGFNPSLVGVNDVVTVALDGSGEARYIVTSSTSSTNHPIIYATATGSELVSNAPQATLTGDNQGTSVTYQTYSTFAMPSEGIDNFYVLTFETNGQVSTATYMAPEVNTYANLANDYVEVVSASSSAVVLEAISQSTGQEDTSVFSSGLLTVTNGVGYNSNDDYIGLDKLQVNDHVDVYTASVGSPATAYYAIVDQSR